MGKVFIYTIAGLMAVLLLFILSLALGSVSIPIQDIIAILLGKGEGVANPSYSYIVLESRLPELHCRFLDYCFKQPSAIPLPDRTYSALAVVQVWQ